MLSELLADFHEWTVISGGTDAPGPQTPETFRVDSSVGAPLAVSGQSLFRVVDSADPHAPPEIVAVTNVSGVDWQVIRGYEGSPPWSHAPNWTAVPVLTSDGLANYVAAATKTFVYTQAIPAASATILHNLGAYPSVTTVTLSGETVEGDVEYIDANTITITFSAPFSWTAYLNG